MNKKIKVIALFGESGAGKDTLAHWLNDNIVNSHNIISYTSRPPRDYEKQDKEYHFISKEEFQTFIDKNQMLEYTEFNGWLYGTSILELKENKINIGVFNKQGIRNLLKKSNQIKILPIWIKTKDKIRLLRVLKRESNPNCIEICRRFIADKKDFSNINFKYEIYENNDEISNYKHSHYKLINILENNNFI